MTLIFLLATVTLLPFSIYGVELAKAGNPVTITVLVALLVCLIPTTIGGLLSAIGLAGIGRMLRANVIATSGRAVEAAGDVDVLLLDKTGTITLGNRQAAGFLPATGVSENELADAAQLGFARRRNAGRSQHRGAGQAEIQPAQPGHRRSRRHIRAFLGAHAHERREFRRTRNPQGRQRGDSILGAIEGRHVSRRSPQHAWTASRGRDRPHWWSPTVRRCSA